MFKVAAKGCKKTSKNNVCDLCDFKCSKIGDWKRHCSTRKHQNAAKMLDSDVIDVKKHPKKSSFIDQVNNTKIVSSDEEKHVGQGSDVKKHPNNLPSRFECVCGISYKHRQSLLRHNKTCSILQGQIICDDKHESSKPLDKDMLTTLVSTMSKFNVENQETLVKVLKEIIPSVGVNNSINTNSHNNINNNFNIQMFLNEKCKNAMNLTDFIETLPITSATYDNTIENGLTKTITNMFVDGLNNMDILERPIHCTDPSRKTLYIKDNDVWEKDNNLNKIENSITRVATKQRTMINKWQDANEGWKTDENLQTKLTSLVFNSMTLIEQDEKETNKIIRAISKNTHLTQEIKDEYK